MKTITARRGIREYQCKKVNNELINKLLTESERTQTMGNLQLYLVVIMHSDEQKRKLAPAHFHQLTVAQAPVVLTFCADLRRTSTWVECRKAQSGYDNFLSFINAATDTLLYCQTLRNLVEEAGLGLCFLGITLYNPKSIIDALQLPRLVMSVAIITLGWSDETPESSDHLPLSAIIHDETYQDYTPERVDQSYHEKESLPENIQLCQVNEKETSAQVFTDMRYTKKDSGAMSKNLLDTFKQRDFL